MSLSNLRPKWVNFCIFGRFGSFSAIFWVRFYLADFGDFQKILILLNFSNFNELNLFDFFVGCYYYGGQQMFFSIQDNFMMTK